MAAPGSSVRTAFVTGASAGLGQAFARMLLADGIRVWGTARAPARLADILAVPGFTPVVLDLADADAAAAAFVRADADAGGFDIVINNAGYGVFGPFAGTDFEVWRTQVDAMLITTARIAHLALGSMRARGRGSLVNVASLATEFPLPYMAGYNMAKAGLSALSESLMVETAGSGVTVLDFRPGDHRTGFNHTMQSQSFDRALEPRLARAWARLEENLRGGPGADRAAADLRRALRRGRSGVVRSGTWFQASLAPLLARLVPLGLRRAVMTRYYGAS